MNWLYDSRWMRSPVIKTATLTLIAVSGALLTVVPEEWRSYIGVVLIGLTTFKGCIMDTSTVGDPG